MTTTLTPTLVFKGFANDGTPLSYGKLYSYQAGTNTPIATYTDSSGSTQNTNPITLNARGECPLWQLPNVGYKFNLTDVNGAQIPGYPIDNVTNNQLVTLYGGVDNGVANAYILNFAASFMSLSNGIVLYFVPGNTNTGASTLSVNGLGVFPIINQDGSALGGSQLVANQVTSVMYYNGNWILTLAVSSSTLQSGTFLGTLTGFTSTTTATFQYRIYNNVAYLFFNTTPPSGTSNATTMTLTGLHTNLFPFSDRFILCCAEDNGNTEQLSGLTITNAGVCTFSKYVTGVFNSTGFTATGVKGLPSDWNISYPLS